MSKSTSKKSWFSNNKFVLLFSFIISILCWFIISLEVSPVTTRIISDVKVDFQLSSINTATELKAYTDSETDTTVKVKVSGKRYVIDTLSNDAVTVVANLDNVKGSGTYTLELTGKKNNNYDFTIESIEPNTITVVLDTESSKNLDVPLNITGATVQNLGSENESLVLENELVNPDQTKVTITGPSKEVQKITKAEAYAKIDKQVTESQKVSARVRLFDATGNVIYDADNPGESSLKNIKLNFTSVVVMQNLYLQKTVPLTYETKNAPAAQPATAIYEVVGGESEVTKEKIESIRIKGPRETISQISSIKLDGVVDYSKITPGNASSFTFKANLPELTDVIYSDYKKAKNLSFEITVDSSDIVTNSFNVPDENISVLVAQNNVTATIKSALKGVNVVGPYSSVSNISASDIKATITVTETTNGTYTKTVALSIENNSDCWFYGEYETSVEITTS